VSRLNGLTRTFTLNLTSHLEGPHDYTTWITHRVTEKGKDMHTEMLSGKIHRKRPVRRQRYIKVDHIKTDTKTKFFQLNQPTRCSNFSNLLLVV